MNDEPYPIGTSVRVSAEFHDIDGKLFDPTTIELTIQRPDRVETTYTFGGDAMIVRDDEGLFHAWIATDQAGRWVYHFEGHGPQDVVNEDTFYVSATVINTP